MRVSRLCGLCLMVPLGLVSGCREAPEASSRSQGEKVVVDTKGLPKLGPYIGPLDEGRVEVAPPRGWHVPGRRSEFLIRFQTNQTSTYPTIIVKAEDCEEVLDVSKKNAAEFVRALKEAGADKNVAPIQIGSFAGATHRRKNKVDYDFKEITVDQLFVETVIAGRKYAFELRTREGTVEQYAPHLYAVARGIKPLKAPGREAPSETVEKPKPKTEPKPKPEPKPEAKPKPEPKPEVKPEKPKKKPKRKKEPDSEFELIPEKD